jgi:hypothetical protein
MRLLISRSAPLPIQANLVEDGIGPVDDGLIRIVAQRRQRLGAIQGNIPGVLRFDFGWT